MPKVKPADVKYLSFEGGGGKGVAYLGAIRELEARKILPLGKQTQVKGMSGSSAGAMTAVLLAMGADAKALETILGKPDDFVSFFSFSRTGTYRSVANDVPGTWALAPAKPSWLTSFASASPAGQAAPLLEVISSTLVKYLAGFVLDGKAFRPLLEAVATHVDTYVANLIFDRGLFAGVGVRDFFAKNINTVLAGKLKAGGLEGKGATLSFQDFVRLTGVELYLTGTNLTTRRPAYFSHRHTPTFPVAEAAAISMNFPFVFKPIAIESPAELAGWWIDGGLLNNLPIHAFDTQQSFWQEPKPATPPPPPPDEPSTLQQGVLAIRLTDGNAPAGTPKVADLKQQAQALVDRAQLAPWVILEALISDFLAAWQYPSEEGQLRTKRERDQTVELYCQKLETLNFTPSKAISDPPVAAARKALADYFDAAEKGL